MIIDAHALAQAMKAQVTEIRNRHIAIVADGRPIDYSAYREEVGRVKCAEQMLEWIDTVIKSDGAKLKG